MSDKPNHKVLYLIDTLVGQGGTEVALAKMAARLPERGWDCAIGSFRLLNDPDFLKQYSCPVLDFTISNTYGLRAWKTAWRLRRFVAKHHIDIIHTMFPTSDLWGTWVATLGTHVRRVSGRRDLGLIRSSKHSTIYRLVGGFYHQIQAVSEAARQAHITADGLNPERVFTVHNGIEIENILATEPLIDSRVTFQLNPGQPIIIAACGRIWPIKGVDTLIRAAAIVKQKWPLVNFLVAGDDSDPYANEMRRLAVQLGVSVNVKLVGELRPMIPVILASDIFCLLSRSEGMSNALLEAMACGLPCIATDVGGNPEVLVNGESGFLVPIDSPQAVATHILELLSDPARRNTMGLKARARATEYFTADRMVDRIVKLYDQLVN